MESSIEKLNLNITLSDYQSAILQNEEQYLKGDINASQQYTYENQKYDALRVVDQFNVYTVVSIIKRTKVGMDGLMIEIAVQMINKYPNIHRKNILFITGMSNVNWQKQLIQKMPNCFSGNVYHHGQLQNLQQRLCLIQNCLIIIDEIDTGDKINQKLHQLLKNSEILCAKYMLENNVKFVFVSATMFQELCELYKWNDLHTSINMTIPDNYISHGDFLSLGIIKEFYPINSRLDAMKWIVEDIIDNYQDDFRIHIIRTDINKIKFIQDACILLNVKFVNNTSDDRIDDEQLKQLFNNLGCHIVMAIKGFYRRSTLIPNQWKIKIGSVFEKYTKNVDMNVQIQGLPGRMTGYWKEQIQNGHKTGPYRTSINAVQEYEEMFKNFNNSSQSTNKKLFLNPVHIKNIQIQYQNETIVNIKYRIYKDFDTLQQVCVILKYTYIKAQTNQQGFIETSLNKKKDVLQVQDVILKIQNSYGGSKQTIAWRTYYPCYLDINDKNTLRLVLVIRPNTNEELIKYIDNIYKSE